MIRMCRVCRLSLPQIKSGRIGDAAPRGSAEPRSARLPGQLVGAERPLAELACDPAVREHVGRAIAQWNAGHRGSSERIARVLLLPGETDLYFRVADNAAELPHLARADMRPIPSVWGHRAGNPAVIPADFAFLKAAVRPWLE